VLVARPAAWGKRVPVKPVPLQRRAGLGLRAIQIPATKSGDELVG